jgi:ABC-2 type transport system permease protein
MKLFGLYLHYLYAMKRNPARLIEILVWPSAEVLLFALLAASATSDGGPANLAVSILTGVIYWNSTARVVQESVAQFIDDFTSRNIQNLLIAPITIGDIVVSLVLASLTKMAISLIALGGILAVIYPSFFTSLGWHSFLWVLQLELFGIALSLLGVSAVLVFGDRASFAGWVLSTAVQIVSLVFYPRVALPEPLRAISYIIPSSYIFESIRSASTDGFSTDITGFILTIGYIAAASLIVRWAYSQSKKSGIITKL